jgi:phosphopantetheinyl transferase (holo-ACP synthase)
VAIGIGTDIVKIIKINERWMRGTEVRNA